MSQSHTGGSFYFKSFLSKQYIPAPVTIKVKISEYSGSHGRTTLKGREIEKEEARLFDLAFDYEMEYGLIINPILQNEEHFNYWLGAYPFYDNVLKEGVLIG